jgi:hypothetical protein
MRGAALCAALCAAAALCAPQGAAAWHAELGAVSEARVLSASPTTRKPTLQPTAPTSKPTTAAPTTKAPTPKPTTPTLQPTKLPTPPTKAPTTAKPTTPTRAPTTRKPTSPPTAPTAKPTRPPIDPNNNPVCQEILGSWWSERASVEAAATPGKCKMFEGNRAACTKQTRQARIDWIKSGKITLKEALEIKCMLISGDKCVENFCNPTTPQACSLQATGGYCIYNTPQAAADFGVGEGCRINPCNAPGLSLDDNTCQARGHAGYFECTYCSVLRDASLKGKGMGCQGTQLNFPATSMPTQKPTKEPTLVPTTKEPTSKPTKAPTTAAPTTKEPTSKPTTAAPTKKPVVGRRV